MARPMTAALALMLASAATPAFSQTPAFPPHSAYGETDDENMAACRVTHASSVAATERTLRSNGIRTVTHTANTLSRDVVLAYININALPVRQGGKETGACAYSINYELYGNTNFTNPVTKARISARSCTATRAGCWSGQPPLRRRRSTRTCRATSAPASRNIPQARTDGDSRVGYFGAGLGSA